MLSKIPVSIYQTAKHGITEHELNFTASETKISCLVYHSIFDNLCLCMAHTCACECM